MPDEMIKLRKGLDKLGVPWEDVSDDKFMKIYRTRFYIGKKRWSVISGCGTYGGEAGLLETWTPTLNGGWECSCPECCTVVNGNIKEVFDRFFKN